jgi:hypothetical protein
MNVNLTSDEAEEVLAGLRFRYYQDRTQKQLIEDTAAKIEAAYIRDHGASPGVWERCLHPPVKVTIKRI